MPKDPIASNRHFSLDGVTDFLRHQYRSVEQSNLAVQFRANLASLYNDLANPSLFDSARYFCLFIGHGRSGSTLVGALLSAHKNVVLSNELNVLRHIRRGMSRKHLYNHIRSTSRSQARHGSSGGGGYSYAVPNQWQGKHERIDVIGDRKAGAVAIQLFREPELLGKLQETVRIPVKFVCVVRNPYDSITTTFRKTVRIPGEAPESHLRRQIESYFHRWAAVKAVFTELGDEHITFVHHEAMLEDTQSQLSDLCGFFAVEPDPSYLEDCASIVKRNPRVTRTTFDWHAELIDEVREKMVDLPWLQRYDFDSQP